MEINAKTLFSITFQWKELECQKQNGPITGYQYRIYHDHLHYTEGSVGPDTTSHTVLISNTEENVQAFSVAAINIAGVGEHSPPLRAATTDSGVQNYFHTWVCNVIIICCDLLQRRVH